MAYKRPGSASKFNDDPLDPKSGFYQPAEPAQPDGADEADPLAGGDAAPAPRQRGTVRRSRGKKARGAVLVALVSLIVLFIFLYFTLFQIRSVRVEGNRTRSAAQIVQLAGLARGANYFTVNREAVERNLSQDRYLALTGFEKRFPSSVVLTVRERALCANARFNSFWYLVDEEGFVLEKLSQSEPRNTLPKVTGLQIRDARVGFPLIPGKDDQMASYELVIQELLNQGYVNEIAEINVADTDAVYLVTNSGFIIRLGWAHEQLMAKIAVARGVIAKLYELDKSGGVIDVRELSRVVYSP